jgi:hypothetical protein
MSSPNTLAAHEFGAPSPEAFMPIEQMKEMTRIVLQDSGRVDDEGRIQPIEVQRTLHGGQWLIGPRTDPVRRTDIFVPTKEEVQNYIMTDDQGLTTRNRIKNPRFDQILYRHLIGRKTQSLTEEQAVAVQHDKVRFENTISGLPAHEVEYTADQLEDAYHVTAVEKPEPDFAPTRVYVPGGVDALKVATAVLGSGADIRYAKIWTPQVSTGEQIIRQDTPIFEVTTFKQLESLMSSLRSLAAEGKLPTGPKPLAGYEVEDLPGVYVGQAAPGTSFNARMGDLFGTSVQEACSQVKLQAGDIVDDDAISKIASNTRQIAQAKVAETDTDPHNHAFLSSQPVDAILAVVNQK